MISEKVIELLKESGWYDTTEDKSYEKSLSDLEIELDTDLAKKELDKRGIKVKCYG